MKSTSSFGCLCILLLLPVCRATSGNSTSNDGVVKANTSSISPPAINSNTVNGSAEPDSQRTTSSPTPENIKTTEPSSTTNKPVTTKKPLHSSPAEERAPSKKAPISTPAPAASSGAGRWVIGLAVVLILILLPVALRCSMRMNNAAGQASRNAWRRLQEHAASGLDTVERRLGLNLRPQKHRTGSEENIEEVQEMTDTNGSVGGKNDKDFNKTEEVEDGEERKAEEEDSSDDYSSLEGVDLREMARQKQEGEMGDSNQARSGELTSVILGEEEVKAKDEDNDLTAL